ncbi:Plastid division protein PDV2 [Raphanus sativus]|nr:Plastid division protein PDV2 [Raphanus sativus]
MEDEEGIGLILARATELRLKINDCIETSSTDVSSPREGKKDEITGLQEKDFDSFSSDDVDDEEESGEQLLCIRDALESLESQLAALQNLRQRQQYEKQVALSEIDYSRKMLLEKLKEYKGKELEVLSEASTFAGERKKSADANGFGSAEVKGPSGVVRFFGSVAKIMLPIIGVISVLAASGYGPEIKKRGVSFKLLGLLPQRVVRAPNQCPPGKVLVIEDGEARCLVKERVEIPFDSVVAKRDVTYGYG